MGFKRGKLVWWLLASLPFACFLLAPPIALLAASVKAKTSIEPDFGQAIELSFKTSLASISLIVIFGLPLAFVIARHKFPGRLLMSALVDVPVAFPPAAAGIALLLAYGRNGMIPTSIGFTTAAVVVAQCFVSCPYFVRAAISAFSALDRQTEDSAEMDGAGPLTRFTKIVLPQSSPQLISGAITSWARALGEFGATILFAGNLVGKTQTMPLAIYLGFESDFDQAVSLSAVLLGTAFVSIIAVRLLTSKSAGQP